MLQFIELATNNTYFSLACLLYLSLRAVEANEWIRCRGWSKETEANSICNRFAWAFSHMVAIAVVVAEAEAERTGRISLVCELPATSCSPTWRMNVKNNKLSRRQSFDIIFHRKKKMNEHHPLSLRQKPQFNRQTFICRSTNCGTVV